MALEITDSNYKEILAEGKPVVIDFWAVTSLLYYSSKTVSWLTNK